MQNPRYYEFHYRKINYDKSPHIFMANGVKIGVKFHNNVCKIK